MGTVNTIYSGKSSPYSSNAIIGGTYTDNALSFHTTHEIIRGTGWGGETRIPYKQMYVGIIAEGNKQIDFRRYADRDIGSHTEIFVATPKL